MKLHRDRVAAYSPPLPSTNRESTFLLAHSPPRPLPVELFRVPSFAFLHSVNSSVRVAGEHRHQPTTPSFSGMLREINEL
jgi:hypothetical protein